MAWKIIVDMKQKTEWENTKTGESVFITPLDFKYIKTGEWEFYFTVIGMPSHLEKMTSRRFKNKSKALAFARKWMKAHPNGG